MGCVILIHIVGCVPPRQDVEINSKFCDTVCVAALSFGELLRGVINVAANELAAVARGEVMMIPASRLARSPSSARRRNCQPRDLDCGGGKRANSS